MDNNPNNPMTWRDLAMFLLDRTSKELKKPISIVWENEGEIADWASGTDQQYKSDGQRFDLSKLVLTRLFFCPTDDDSDCEMAIVVSPKFVKPKKRYTVRINRVMDAEVFAESKEQAEEIGHKIANEDIPDYAIDSLLEIMGSCNFEFVCVHDEVLDVADGFFTEEECEEILKG